MNYERWFEDARALNYEARILDKHGLKSAALFYLNKNETVLRRTARAVRTLFEECDLPPYNNSALYPYEAWSPSLPQDDKLGHGLKLDKGGAFAFQPDKFRKFVDTVEDDTERHVLERVFQDMELHSIRTHSMDMRHGGRGHVDGGHWVMDHREMLRSGLSGYKARILEALGKEPDEDGRQFHEAMLDTVEGLIRLARRMAGYLRDEYARNPSPRLERLAQAYANVPERPASSFFEAVVCVQFFMFYAAASEPGRMDHYLLPYYREGLRARRVSEAEASELLDVLLDITEKRIGTALVWHLVVGGDGEDGYNELTTMILRLSHRRRQPNVSLRVREDMPDELWDEALLCVGSGGGQPSLVNDAQIQRSLVERVHVKPEDAADFTYGGCSETFIPGQTFCQSLLSMVNLPEILEECVRWDLAGADSYEKFHKLFLLRVKGVIADLMRQLDFKHQFMATHHAEPVKTLLTKGCLERGRGFYQGGANYNFENTGVVGVPNVSNALRVLQACFSGEIPLSKDELRRALLDNFEGHAKTLAIIKGLPKFGNDTPDLNALAQELSTFVFGEMNAFKYPDGRWVNTPSIIAYTTFVYLAKHVGATPDGRRDGEAFADSCGPLQGTDLEGPAAVLKSAAAIPQFDAPGTCVLNLLLDATLFKTRETRDKVKGLFKTYFKLGGTQLQVSVMDRGTLEKALREPEKHGNLIVRIAGYCDYFTTQTKPVQREIVKRTQHSL